MAKYQAPVDRVTIRHRIYYVLYRVTMRVLGSIPPTAARRIGGWAGHLFRWVDRRRWRLTLGNLALALPEKPEAERRRIARACFAFFGSTVFDAAVSTHDDPETTAARFDVEGWHHLEAVEARGTGMVIMSAHWGSWEALARYLGHALGELHIVSRPPNNPLLVRDLQEMRRRYGHVLVPKRRAGHRMLRLLKGGHRLGILIDQRVRPKDGILETFLGHPAWTSPLLAFLSSYTGAPVVPVFCRPTPGGRFALRVEPPIEAAGRGPDAEAALTRAYLAAVEAVIRREPELWMWMHRRWQRTAAVKGAEHVERYRGRSSLPASSFASWRWPSPQLAAKVAPFTKKTALERGDHLLLVGAEGAGKTHLAAGIGHALIDAGHEIRYLPAPILADELIKDAARAERANLHRRLDVPALLIVDDLDAVAGDPEAARTIEDFVARRRHRRATVLVSRAGAIAWPDLVPADAGLTVTL